MTDAVPQRRASRRAYDGRLIKVDVDTLEAPDGSTFDLELIRHPGAAAVAAVLDDTDADNPSVLLIRQFRYAASGTIWEVPAGVLEPGEDPMTCARRELAEETGATAGRIEHLTTIYTTPGFTDEQIHLFVASELRLGETNHEPDEFIEVQAVPIRDALAMIKDGQIVDAKSIVALLYVAGYDMGM
jgi:ADP-ribose pyrophosphatase